MTAVHAVCVFCGSSTGIRPEYAAAARQLGAALAAKRLALVYGAGNIGLMGVLADAVLAAGGEVVGVIPQALMARELGHGKISELHVVETMHQRKALMADKSDAFIAMPGGYGTLDELFEILTWAQLGIHEKPIGLLNINGFFDPLLAWVRLACAEGFVRQQHVDLLRVAAEPAAMVELVTRPHPVAAVTKWAEREDR